MNQPKGDSNPDDDRRPCMLLGEIPVWIAVVMVVLFVLIALIPPVNKCTFHIFTVDSGRHAVPTF